MFKKFGLFESEAKHSADQQKEREKEMRGGRQGAEWLIVMLSRLKRAGQVL